jgi:hypothetical protein
MILDQLFEATGEDSTAQRVVEVLRQVHPDPSEATEREILAATGRVLSDQGMSAVRVRFYLRDPDFQSDIIEAVQALIQGVAEGSGNNDNNDFYSGLYAELLGDVNNHSVTDMVNTKNSIKRALESGRLSLADVKSEIHQLESELKKQGAAEGHADQQRKIVKKNGEPVGEIGIDRESSPGVGQYYMRHYASGTDLSGYDSFEEAMDELKYAVKQSVKEGMKPSDIPPSMRDRLTMRDIERERPAGAFRFRVTFDDGSHTDFMDFESARASADIEQGRISRLSETQAHHGRKAHSGRRSTARIDRILQLLRARNPQAQNDLEALILDFRGQQAQDRSDIARLDAENDMEEADIERLEAMLTQLKQRKGTAVTTESLRDGEYHVATVTLDDGTEKKVRITSDEGFRDQIRKHFEKQGREVRDIDVDYSVRSELDEAKKKPQPTNPELWSRAKSAARSKFNVYPSAYANAWAAKWYKSKGGGWRMGKPKKD